MTGSTASQRLLSPDALTHRVVPDGGSEPLRTASTTLGSHLGSEVGVWQAAPGSDRDVEVDEVFVVVRGSGSVAFDDGSAIALSPGVVVQLRRGDRTTWNIQETLRKVYLT